MRMTQMCTSLPMVSLVVLSGDYLTWSSVLDPVLKLEYLD